MTERENLGGEMKEGTLSNAIRAGGRGGAGALLYDRTLSCWVLGSCELREE